MDGAVVPIAVAAEGYPHFVLPVSYTVQIMTQSIKNIDVKSLMTIYLEGFKATINVKTGVIAFGIARINRTGLHIDVHIATRHSTIRRAIAIGAAGGGAGAAIIAR